MQLPITTERSEAEPDLALLQGTYTDFRNHHPRGTDCRLVIEVADTSLEKDRAKASIYRSAGVKEYWVVNVAEKCIERYELAESSPVNQPTLLQRDSQISLQCGEAECTLDLKRVFE